MKEADILQIINILLKVLKIKITRKTILENIHYRLWQESDWLTGMANAIRDCGIDAVVVNLHFNLFEKLPINSIIYLKEGVGCSSFNNIYLLIEKSDHDVKLMDQRSQIFIVEKSELSSIWSNAVIAIDFNESCNEIDYEQKLIEQNTKLKNADGGVSVIMPVFNQAHYVLRAIKSLFLQSYNNWELIIIDDGSTDDLKNTIAPFCENERLRYFRNDKNIGLGASINLGLEKANYDFISYLPADDCYFKDHLKLMVETLILTNSKLVYSGVNFDSTKWINNNYGNNCYGTINGEWLQLVQVLHYKTKDKWLERNGLVTDDLNIMYWNNFINQHKKIIGTREITCEWLDHPEQRHKAIDERGGGGIYFYKEKYGVTHPLKFKSSYGNLIDETMHYKYINGLHSDSLRTNYRKLKILLVGELSFNPERILAFEERGHKLLGLWMKNPSIVNASGALPVGNIQQIPINNWQVEVSKIKPDIIYAQQDYRAVPFAHHVLVNNPGIPFVSHFKESPFHCRDNNMWRHLIDLYSISDGQIYTSLLMREWMQQYLINSNKLSYILDGDMPKNDCFTIDQSELLSKKDGAIHTCIVGRPLGMNKSDVLEIVKQKIHMHFYGNIFQNQSKPFFNEILSVAPSHVHLHETVNPENWVKEFSQYDAGWLHHFQSNNNSELIKLNWHDLNTPARMAQYAMAGIPMLLKNNKGHKVACQEILEKDDMVILYDSLGDLSAHFSNKVVLDKMRRNIWDKRFQFSFDYYVDDLIDFFHSVIDSYKIKKEKESFNSKSIKTLHVD